MRRNTAEIKKSIPRFQRSCQKDFDILQMEFWIYISFLWKRLWISTQTKQPLSACLSPRQSCRIRLVQNLGPICCWIADGSPQKCLGKAVGISMHNRRFVLSFCKKDVKQTTWQSSKIPVTIQRTLRSSPSAIFWMSPTEMPLWQFPQRSIKFWKS